MTETERLVRCRECLNIVPFETTKDYCGQPICEACLEKYAVCSFCNSLSSVLDDELIEYNGESYCPTCVENKLARCQECDEYFSRGDPDARWGYCPSCAKHYFCCENCDEVLHEDNYGADGLCQTCFEGGRHDGALREYHDTPDFVFHPNERHSLYFGVELETDEYRDRDEAILALSALSEDEQLFYLSEDNSLSNGIEIISQPCTLGFHRDSFPWAKIVEIVTNHGGRSHDTETCGLHIHFSRDFFDHKHSDLYQVRLIYLFEKFWAELVKFSRRAGEQWLHYACRYGYPMFDKPAKLKVHELKHNFYRNQAVNITNRKTVEIRLFRGSLNVETILATIELVDFLVRLVRNTATKKLQVLAWTELVTLVDHEQYRYLPNYLKEHGLCV